MTRMCLLCSLVLLGLILVPGAAAQDSQPASASAPLTARVLEVQGDVQHAALESTEWTKCAVGDEYPQETVIRTGVRASIKFQIGDDDTYTALVIDSASKVVLSEAARTSDTKRVRIGVGYGRVRAGVAEGALKSDFTVDSPVATLSKRGTWNFGLFYERDTDRFEIFLLDQGLVDAFSKITGMRREVLPRELVTQVMRLWMDQAQLLRNVPIPDMLGQGDIDVAFNTLGTSGLRVLDAHGGYSVLLDLSSAFSQQTFANQLRQGFVPAPITPGERVRPEGYFGTGRLDELIPVVIEANSPLVQKGLARPGQYNFRRSALENWLAKHPAK